MGQSVPTTTMMLDRFADRYAGFRAELDPEEQRCFDELVCRARRHSQAINRRPDLDFERPVFLSMLMEEAARHDATLARLLQTERRLAMVLEVLHGAGVDVPQRPHWGPDEMVRLGQTRLVDGGPWAVA